MFLKNKIKTFWMNKGTTFLSDNISNACKLLSDQKLYLQN